MNGSPLGVDQALVAHGPACFGKKAHRLAQHLAVTTRAIADGKLVAAVDEGPGGSFDSCVAGSTFLGIASTGFPSDESSEPA